MLEVTVPPEHAKATKQAPVTPSAQSAHIKNAIALIWAQILEIPTCSEQNTFIELGGDSIAAMQVVSRLRDQFAVSIALDLMFDQMTIQRLARLIEDQLSDRETRAQAKVPGMNRQPRDQPLPVSHSQRRMWLVQEFAPGSTAYNVTFALRLRGPLDQAHLLAAWQTVWSRHEVFRTTFTTTSTGVRQSVATKLASFKLDQADFSDRAQNEQERLASAYFQQSAATPFDLHSDTLWRCHLVCINDADHILAWVAHHIITDLWSNLILASELAQTYNALLNGHAPSMATSDIDCADHAHWQVSPAVVHHLEPQLAYWLERLKDLSPLALPTDRPMTPHWHRSGKRVTRSIPTSILSGLKTLSSSGGYSLFMILLAGLNVLLSRQARQTDIAVATPIANRHQPNTEHLVGSLVNTLVMRNDLSGNPSFQELLHQVKATALEAYAHQDLPFDLLVEKLGTAHRQEGTPLGLPVMLNLHNVVPGQFQFHKLETSRFMFDRGSTQFPLTLSVDIDQTQSVYLEYADTLFDHTTAEAFVDNYLSLLGQALASPDARLSSLKWLSPAERAKLHEWNQTGHATVGSHPTVSGLIARCASRHPQAIAIKHQSQTVTYSALALQARHVAQSLRDQGIGVGHRVGICLERGPGLLASVWGIWMAGAAYVPLDPAYPAERLQYMASDAKVALVITHHALEAQLEWPSGLLLLLEDAMTTTIKDDVDTVQVGGDTPAYVIYTSGSTGQPKGVVVPHRAVVNFLGSMAQRPGLSSRDRLLAVTTLSFDISVLELMLPLTVGAQIVMASNDDVLDGQALKSLIDQHKINVMQATPSTWRLLIEAGWLGSPGDFKVLVGGESLSHDLATQLLKRADQVWNMYGPTETTVWSTCWRVVNPAGGIRIGTPIHNTQVWVLDEHGHHCPIGTPGEIVIGGDGVALGYWDRASLTDERFIPDSFSGQTHARLYKTGDLGRWVWNGELEHLGRLDFQIKVRGHRIEPGEIESQLTRHPSVAQALVIAREDTPGDVRLIAYIVPRQSMPSTTELREHARHSLPEHLRPQHYVELSAVPLLANGKVNRQGLPAPKNTQPETSSEGVQNLLSTDTQKLLALTWQELLGVNHIHLHDNFFDLGGHSLLAIQAIAKMEKTTGKRVSARRYIFESLAQLANSYDQAPASGPKEAFAPAFGFLQRLLRRQPKP